MEKLETPRLAGHQMSIKLTRGNSKSHHSISKSDQDQDRLLDRAQSGSPVFGQRPRFFTSMSNITTGSGVGYMGIYDYNTKSLNPYDRSSTAVTPVGALIDEKLTMPAIPPLFDSPQLSLDHAQLNAMNSVHSESETSFFNDRNISLHDHDIVLSEGLMEMRDVYETKMAELINDHKREMEELLDRYDACSDKLEKSKSDYKQQGKKLNKKLKTIKDLRNKITEYEKKLTGRNKQCYVFEWFS